MANAGTVELTAAPVLNPDSVSAEVALTAVAQPDSYVFAWSPQVSQSTLSKNYNAYHATRSTLAYASGAYVETISNSDLQSLVTFTASRLGLQADNVTDACRAPGPRQRSASAAATAHRINTNARCRTHGETFVPALFNSKAPSLLGPLHSTPPAASLHMPFILQN